MANPLSVALGRQTWRSIQYNLKVGAAVSPLTKPMQSRFLANSAASKLEDTERRTNGALAAQVAPAIAVWKRLGEVESPLKYAINEAASSALQLCLQQDDVESAADIALSVRCTPTAYVTLIRRLLQDSKTITASDVYRAALGFGVTPANLRATATGSNPQQLASSNSSPTSTRTNATSTVAHANVNTTDLISKVDAIMSTLNKQRSSSQNLPIRLYNVVLKQLLNLQHSELVHSDLLRDTIETVLGYIRDAHGRSGGLPMPTSALLFNQITEFDQLRGVVSTQFLSSNRVPNQVRTMLVLKFVEIFKTQPNTPLGPQGWWLLKVLKHAQGNNQLEGVAYVKLMTLFAEAKLVRHAASLHDIMHTRGVGKSSTTLLESTLLALIHLCGEFREVEDSKKSRPMFSINKQIREDRRITNRNPARVAGQLWIAIENKAAALGTVPSLDAHTILLKTACTRGDMLFIQQAHRLMRHRYPSEARTTDIYEALLYGCVAARNPLGAMEYASRMTSEHCTPQKLFAALTSPREYRYFAAVVEFCMEKYYCNHTPAVAAKLLQAQVLSACKSMIAHQSRRTQYQATKLLLLPVPNVNNLCTRLRTQNTSSLTSTVRVCSRYEPPVALGACVNEAVAVFRLDPLAAAMIRNNLPKPGTAKTSMPADLINNDKNDDDDDDDGDGDDSDNVDGGDNDSEQGGKQAANANDNDKTINGVSSSATTTSPRANDKHADTRVDVTVDGAVDVDVIVDVVELAPDDDPHYTVPPALVSFTGARSDMFVAVARFGKRSNLGYQPFIIKRELDNGCDRFVICDEVFYDVSDMTQALEANPELILQQQKLDAHTTFSN